MRAADASQGYAAGAGARTGGGSTAHLTHPVTAFLPSYSDMGLQFHGATTFRAAASENTILFWISAYMWMRPELGPDLVSAPSLGGWGCLHGIPCGLQVFVSRGDFSEIFLLILITRKFQGFLAAFWWCSQRVWRVPTTYSEDGGSFSVFPMVSAMCCPSSLTVFPQVAGESFRGYSQQVSEVSVTRFREWS